MTKQEVRSEIARRVKNLSPVYCQEADEAICRLVVALQGRTDGFLLRRFGAGNRHHRSAPRAAEGGKDRGTASVPGERRYGGPAH